MENIYTQAINEDNTQQQIKATIYKTKLILNTEELGLETVVSNLESSIDRSKSPTKEILHSLAAELFNNYYSSQYYLISQRTNMADFDKNDIRTWSPNNYRDYISEQYLQSVTNTLKTYKTKNFKELIANKKDADYSMRPTLYELLADRALKYFSNTNMQGISPSFKFRMRSEEYLGTLDEFIKIKPSTTDKESMLYRAFTLYQEVLSTQKEKANLKVLAAYDLRRLDFVLQKGDIKSKNEIYFATLQKMTTKFTGFSSHVYKLKIGEQYFSKKAYEKALKIYNELLNDNPESSIKTTANNRIASINQKKLILESEQVIPTNQAFVLKVSHRNIDKACFKLVKVETGTFANIFSDNEKDQRKKIESLPVLKEWEHNNLKNGYSEHHFEEVIDGLQHGKYIIISSNDSDYKGKNAAYVYTALYVSDIAYITYDKKEGKEISVRNRKTGKPIKNAVVKVFSNEYNRTTRKQDKRLLKTLKTNQDGLVTINSLNSRSYTIEVEYNGDLLDVENHQYYREWHDNNNQSEISEIFTDRAIYRPGQTVHYKVLSMKIDKNRVPSISSNKSDEIVFRDANNQEIIKHKIITNEFGSASGSFVIPNGKLTGAFTLSCSGAYKSVSIEEYKRPKFEVEIEDNKKKIKQGDLVKVEGHAKSLSGSPVSNAKVTYTVIEKQQYQRYDYYGRYSYRNYPSNNNTTQIASGELLTNNSGDFDFDFKTEIKNNLKSKYPSTFIYEISISVTDQSGETKSQNKIIKLSSLPYSYDVKLKEIQDVDAVKNIEISAKNNADLGTSSKAILKITELEQPDKWKKPRKWNVELGDRVDKNIWEEKLDRISYTPKSSMADYPERKVVFEKEIVITENGIKHDFSKHLKNGCYKIELISKQKYDNQHVELKKYVAITNTKKGQYPTYNLLYTHDVLKKATIGEKYKLILGTPDKELTAYYHIIRSKNIIESGFVDIDNQHTICYEPSLADKGGFSIQVDFVKHNYHERKVFNIQLPWDDKQMNVELLTIRDKVLPGSKEKWSLKLKDNKGEKVAAEMLATMYDASLDQFVPNNYTFNPFPSNFGSINSQFIGFGQGRTGNINYQWSRVSYEQMIRNTPPYLISMNIYNNNYGDMVSTRAGGRQRTKRTYGSPPTNSEHEMVMDGVQKESDDAAMSTEVVTNQSMNKVRADDKSSLTNESVNLPDFAIRKNLNESVFFFPHLKTDKEGNILLEFTMNEALTTWKMLTFSHDKELRYGLTSHQIKTQKDVMIVPNAPRFLREGDVLVFPATVSNLSENDLEINTELELINPSNDESLLSLFGLENTVKVIEVKAGESARIDWTIKVPHDYKKLIKYRVKAKSGSHTDGEENLLPLVTNQKLVTTSKIISLKKNEQKTIVFDKVLNDNSTSAKPFRYTLEYTSNPVWYAVQALPYLMDYPHQCTEQIFNRLYANTMASHIATANPKFKSVFDQWSKLGSDALLSNLEKNQELKSAILEETPWVRAAQSETEQKKRIALLFDLNRMSNETKQYMQQLKKRQLPNGGFPWFPGGRADTYITQNLIEGILHLQHLEIISVNDYEWSQVLNNAMHFIDEQTTKRYTKLKNNIKKYGGKLSNDHLDYLSIHYLYINSFNNKSNSKHSEAYKYYYHQAEKYWLGKGLYSESMIGLTLKRSNSKVANDINKSLTERSFYSEDLGRYWNINNGYNWHELPIETHAMLIEFFTETDKEDSFVEDMKIWLLKNKQTNHWKTTKGTAAAIYALLIQGEDGVTTWIEETIPPTIMMGNTPLTIDANNTESGTGYYKKSWIKDDITDNMATVNIKNNSDVINWGAIYYQYFEDLDKIEDFKETPLKMNRTMYKEVSTDRGPQLIAIDKNVTVTPGDRIIARITIKVDRSMSYVHLKDMRGSGFEPENVLSGYKWSGGLGYYESTKDLASHFFISNLPKGTFVFEYPMRAVHKGEFSTGIATLQSMYAPEFISNSEGGRIIVK
ncbi:MAG: alpha-2-macroglobulin family protein [Saprospiraceae bacterium]